MHTALLREERAKDLTRLHELEDDAIRDAVRRQEDIGLPVVTDGGSAGSWAQGHDVDAILANGLELDRRVVDGLPDHVTTCLHQCRATTRRATSPSTTSSPSTQRRFSRCRTTASSSSGTITSSAPTPITEALRRVGSPGPTVVLGVVSTRHRELEDEDEDAIVARSSGHPGTCHWSSSRSRRSVALPPH